MMKIARLALGSSVQFRRKEFSTFDSARDKCAIQFDKGVFTVTCLKDAAVEPVCFATTNTRYWVPQNEASHVSDAPAHEQIGAEPKRRGRPPKAAE